MTASIAIQPTGSFNANLSPPGSKSLTNRALLLAALAGGESTLRRPLFADDSKHMLAALKTLGFTVTVSGDNQSVRVVGLPGKIPRAASPATPLHLGNAGTAYRFLTAALTLGQGDYVLDGVPRMHERPIGQLVDALRSLGANIDYFNKTGFPPLMVHATGTLSGGEITMPPTLSSQYISALLQVGCYFKKGLTLCFDGPVTSRPYVEMTLALMSTFGVSADVDPDFTRIRIEPGHYKPTHYLIEPDASNASYFLAAGAIIPGSKVTIEGLGKSSLQGDVGFADVLHQMGAGLVFGRDFITVTAPPSGQSLHGIDIDLNSMPDMAQTLATTALFAQGPTTIRNIGNLRVKETDRMEALRVELLKLGASVEVEGDDLTITPPADGKLKPAAIDTYDDHRMAMSFAIVGLRSPGVTINDPQCVNKTFPEFFEYLEKLCRPKP